MAVARSGGIQTLVKEVWQVHLYPWGGEALHMECSRDQKVMTPEGPIRAIDLLSNQAMVRPDGSVVIGNVDAERSFHEEAIPMAILTESEVVHGFSCVPSAAELMIVDEFFLRVEA